MNAPWKRIEARQHSEIVLEARSTPDTFILWEYGATMRQRAKAPAGACFEAWLAHQLLHVNGGCSSEL